MKAVSDALELSALSGDWKLHQRVEGHRFSTDDVVAAGAAVLGTDPPPRRVLDLGCGIGSVALMLAWRWRDVAVVGVEAQLPSITLARRSAEHNGAAGRVTLVHGDLRDEHPEIPAGTFDLVTGTPPYIPLGSGTVSNVLQKAYCRFEIRGDVCDYLMAGRRALRPDGTMWLIHGGRQVERVARAADEADMEVRSWRLVVPVVGREPLISVYRLTPTGRAPMPEASPPLVVRTASGARTPEMRALRDALGMPEL